MNQRRPRTALRSSALPSLAALLASGVAVEGCGPQDGSVARGDRLSTHGHNAARAVGNGRFGDALREVGMGIGLLDAPAPIDVTPAGAMPVVNPQPPPEQPMAPSGAVAPVLPQPPPEQPPHTAGGPMMVDPAPPPPPPVERSPMDVRGARSIVRPDPPPEPETGVRLHRGR
jgi:hypothetical protein